MTSTNDSPICQSVPVSNTLICPQLVSPVIENDDEAKHRTRIRVLLANANTITQHKDGFDNCLKIFNDNKISKENVWQMSLIDHFQALVDKHHKTLNSFQKVSSSLEASSKIYGIRVDSVHSDVLHMSSGLIRQKIIENPDESLCLDTSADQPSQEKGQRPVLKNKRRLVSTVTKNRDTINAKLEQTAETDAIFAKLNSTVESNKSAKKLLQYVLSSCASELRLCMNYKIWNNEETPINEPGTLDVYGEPIYDLPDINWNPSKDDVIRSQITGYVISNTPAEDDGNYQTDASTENPNDKSYIDVQFDIDADVEPIQEEADFIDVNISDDDLSGLAEDDQYALKACRGLQQVPIVINDMRPDNVSLDLEYSYRLLPDKIDRFWAGPSYWKFKKLRTNAVRSTTVDKKKKTFKNQIEPTEFEDADESLYISVNGLLAAKLEKGNIYKCNRFDARTYKLPSDYKLNRNRFLLYPLAPGISLPVKINNSSKSAKSDQNTREIDNDVEYYNEFQNDYASDGCVVDNFALNECSSATVTEIATEFFDAPEQVNQINVTFAKTAKVVDMKQLKHCCLNIIQKEWKEKAVACDLPSKSEILNEDYSSGSSSFYQIYNELPKNLTKNMKEALSPAVAFYSILHLSNDNNFRLIKDDENGFLIRQIL